MSDNIKDAYNLVSGTGIFIDEKDFRQQLTSSPKDVFDFFNTQESTSGMFLDYNDFETILGLKKKVGAEPSGVSQSPFNGKGAALLPTTKSQGIPLLTKEDDTTPNFLPEAVVDFEKYTKGLPKGSKKPSPADVKKSQEYGMRFGIIPSMQDNPEFQSIGIVKEAGVVEKQYPKIEPAPPKEKIKDLAEPAALLASAINNTKKIDAKAQWEKITPTAQIEYDGYVQQGGTLPIQEYAKERIVELETTDFVGNEIKLRQTPVEVYEQPEGTPLNTAPTPSNTAQLVFKALDPNYPQRPAGDIGMYLSDGVNDIKRKDEHSYLILDNVVRRINSGEVKWDVPGVTMPPEFVGAMRDLKVIVQNKMQVDMSILSKSLTDFDKKYKDHKPLMDSIQAKVADIEHYTSIVNAASVEGATPEQIAEAQRIEPLYKKAHGEYQKLMTTYTTLFDKKSVEKYDSDLAAYKQLQQKYNSLPYYFSKYDKEYQNVTNLIGDFNTATGAKDVVVDVIYSSLDQLANALKSTTNFITQAPYRAGAFLTDIEFLDNLVLSFDANTKYKNIHQVSSGFFQDQVGYLPMKELSIEQKKDLARYNPGVDIEKLKPSDFVKTPLDKWKPVNFVATIAATIGEMYLLPNKMSAAVSTMTGASRATAMTSLMYMRSYEDNYSRMLNTEGLSDGERVWLAATLSAMEGLSEQIMPDYKLFDKGSLAKNLVMAYSRGGKAEALRAGSKILLQTAEENLEEQAVLFGTAGLEAITNSLKGREIFEPQDLMGEAVNTALITSAVMGVLGAGGTYRVAKQFFDPANMDAQNLVYLSHDSQFKELPQILNELELGGEITAEKRNEITTMVANIREIKSKLPESLSENFTAIKLMAERNELLSQLKPVDKADFMDVNKDLNHKISLVEKELERMSALAEYQYRNIKEVNYFTEKENGKNVYFKQESDKEKEKITQKEFRDDIARLKSFGATLTNKGGLVTFEEVRDKINVYRSETTEALRKKIEEIRYGTVAEGKGKKRGKNKVIPLKLSEARRRQLLSEVIDKLNPEFRQRATPIVETALRELEAGNVSADSIKRLTKSLAQSQQFANMDEVRYNQSTQSFEGIKAGTVVRSIALNQISGNTEWINPFAMQEDTLVHELAAHPYVSTMAMEAGTKDGKLFNFADEAQRDSEYERLMSANLNDLNPQAQILRKGFALIHNTEYISRVQSAGYSGKFGLYEEALVQAIGDYGAAMNTEEKRQSFLDIIKDLIKWLGGKAFKNRGLNPREFRKMDIKTYLAAVTSDITTTPGVAPAKLGIRKGRMNFQVEALSSVVGGEVKFGTAFDMQDATAEDTVGKEKGLWGKAQVWRERIENAGDILRELSSRGDKPDVKYLMEKVKKLRDWIAQSKKGYTPIDKSIKTIEDFEKTSLRWSDAVDSREYIEKFHSNILDRIRSEYEAIHTYTKEQRLAVELVIDLINNNIKGLESKLNEIENISNQIKSNGKLPIIADIKLGKVVEQSLKEAPKAENQNKNISLQNETGAKQPVAGNRLFNRPIEAAKKIADRYFKAAFGTERTNFEGTRKLDKERAKRIADAYADMKNDPDNPEVKAAYEAMVKETVDQYKEIIKDGYFIEVNNEEAYANSEEMIEDLRNNKRMKIFSTEAGYGDSPITEQQRKENPLLKDSGFKDKNGVPLLNNDIFRAVHDFFGHAELGNSFGALGEENAWNVHSRMYSPLARKAVTTETRGQNSYVNFSGVNAEAQKLLDEAAKLRSEGKLEEALKITESIYEKLKFADQKIGLLPEEFTTYDDEVQVEKTPAPAKAEAPKFQISGTQYTFTGEEKDFEGITVRRIKYGDTVGGWIEFEDNIQGGKVLGDAVVIGDAMVMDDAVVSGKAVIDGTEGRVVVAGTSVVSGDVSITGTVDIDGETMITGHVSINADNLFIKSSTISGNVSIDLQGLANLDGEYIVGTYGINDLADITQETTEAQSFIEGIHNRLRGVWSNVQGFVNRSAEDISSEDIQNISLKSLIERLPITEDDKKIIEDSTKSAMVTGEYKILEDETIIDRINHKVRNIDIIPKNGDIDRQIDALTKSLESMPQNKLKDLVRLRLSDLHATKFLREKWVKEMQSRPGFESTVKDLAIVSDVNDYGTMTRYLVDAEGNSYGNMSVSAHGFVITAAIKRAYHGDTELGSKNKLAEALYRGITNGMIATTGARLKSDGTFQATEYINPKTGLKEERFRAKDFWEKLIKYGYAEIDERGNYVALFQIIGEQGAQYLPKISNDLNIAQAMERDLGLEIDYWDVPDKEQLKKMYKIRLATGWERGKDGLWRYELDPIKLKFSTKEGLKKVLEGKPVMSEGAIRVPLSEIIDTKPFGQHYNLDDVFVYFDPYENTYNAHYANNAIGVSLALRSIDSGVTVLKSVLSHEIQHHIQKKEGFSMGGGISVGFTLRRDIEDTKDKIRELKSIKEIVNEKDIPNYDLQISELETKLNDFVKLYKQITDEDEDKLYFKSYEEVEARNVQNRIGMTKGERIATLLRHTEDVAPEHQILIPEVTYEKSLTEGSENMVVIMSKILGRGLDELSDTDIKSRYEQFMSEIEEAEGYTPTTRALRAMEDDIIDDAVKFQLIYHSGDGVLTEWDESKFKGGSRASHGWGMYFSRSQYKAEDYGKIKAVFDDADFNIFDLDKKVTEETIKDLAIRIGGEEAWEKRRDYINFNTGNTLYDVILEKLLDAKGTDFDTARKIVLNKFKWDANKRYAEMLVAAGYDAVSEDNGYYFVIINGQKYNEVYNKYKELGEMPGGVKFQINAWHGTPYNVDRFSLDKIGTGEGAQAFGWGLYFTDIKDIAEHYADKLSASKVIDIDGNPTSMLDLPTSYLYDYNDYENANKLKNVIIKDIQENTKSIQSQIDYQLSKENPNIPYVNVLRKSISDNEQNINKMISQNWEFNKPTRNLYKVTLHEGKTPDQYTWLEWDKKISEINQKKINSQFEKEGLHKTISSSANETMRLLGKESDFKTYRPNPISGNGHDFYQDLVRYFLDSGIKNPQKEASLFLLRAGIDGIKYPAESIARGATSDTARGFNYVVFDENAITIEEVIKFQMTSPITPDVTNKVLNQLDKEGYPIKSFSRKIVVYNSTDIYIDDKGSMGDLYSDVIFPIFKTRTEALRFLNRAGINLSVPAEVKFAIQPTIPTNEIRQVVKEGMDMMYTPELIRNEIIKIYNLKRKADIEALDVVMDEVYHDKTGKYMVLKNRRSARKAIKNNRGDMYVAETIHDIAERWNQMSDIDKEVVRTNASITPGDLASKAFKMVELRLDGKEETEEYLTLYEEMKNAGTQIGKALNIFKLFSVGAQSKEKTLNDRFKLYGKKLPDNVEAEFKKLFTDIEDLTREIKMGAGVLSPIDILIKEADLEKLTRRQDLLWAQYNPEQTSMLRLFDAGKGNLFKIVTMGVNLVSNVVSNITNIAIFTPVSLIRGKAGHVLTKSDLVFGVRKGLPLTLTNIVENYKYGTYSSTSESKVGGFGSHQMLRYFNPFIEAVGATFETYIKGTPTEEVAEKYKMLLTKTKSGDLRITKRDIAKKIWMGTVGANSDIMLRTLVTGDAPFTNTVYLANLKRLARKEGITDEKKINDFITNAPHWAHEVALELAKTATFTQENPATEWIGKFKKSLLNTAETSTNPAKQFGAGAAYITTGVILPFTHVPLNFVYALTKMMAPTVYFADMAVIAGRIKQYDTSIEKEMGKTNPDRNRIEHWNKKKREEKNKLINKSYEMGAVIGVHFVFKLLAMSGAFAATGGDDDKEFKKKQLDKGEVNTVNFGIFLRWINHDRTKIWVPKSEPTDFKVNISKLGLLGIVPTVFANNYHKQAVKLRARGQEYQPTLDNTLFDIDSMLEMLTNITPALQESLQLTFVQSISKIFGALSAEGESGAQKAANVTTDLVNTVVTQVMFPNNAVGMFQANRDYIPASNKRFGLEAYPMMERFENLLKNKVNIKGQTIMDEFGNDIPQTPKNFVWGDGLLARWMYHNVSITKITRVGDEKNLAIGMYQKLDDYMLKATDNGIATEPFPITLKDANGISHSMTPEQYQKYCKEMGKIKELLVQNVFNTPGINKLLTLADIELKANVQELEDKNLDPKRKAELLSQMKTEIDMGIITKDGKATTFYKQLTSLTTGVQDEVRHERVRNIINDVLWKNYNKINKLYDNYFVHTEMKEQVSEISPEVRNRFINADEFNLIDSPEIQTTMKTAIETIQLELTDKLNKLTPLTEVDVNN